MDPDSSAAVWAEQAAISPILAPALTNSADKPISAALFQTAPLPPSHKERWDTGLATQQKQDMFHHIFSALSPTAEDAMQQLASSTKYTVINIYMDLTTGIAKSFPN